MPTIQLCLPFTKTQTKKCTRCKHEKPLDQFSKRGDSDRPRSHCNQCKKLAQEEYRERNREKVKAGSTNYRKRLGASLNKRIRQWRKRNPDRDRAIHSKWKANHKDAVNASTHRRRAQIKGNGGSYTAAEWQAIKAAQDHRCLMCGRREPEIKLTVDHVIPVSQGGPNTADNIQGLCKSCNSKKHRKVLDLRRL